MPGRGRASPGSVRAPRPWLQVRLGHGGQSEAGGWRLEGGVAVGKGGEEQGPSGGTNNGRERKPAEKSLNAGKYQLKVAKGNLSLFG